MNEYATKQQPDLQIIRCKDSDVSPVLVQNLAYLQLIANSLQTSLVIINPTDQV
jgi:hypothetical protein